VIKLLEWLLIFFLVGCASTSNRLDSKYNKLSGIGWEKVKQAPYCIWKHNCYDADSMFSRLVKAGEK
jgi:hypothetical protein